MSRPPVCVFPAPGPPLKQNAISFPPHAPPPYHTTPPPRTYPPGHAPPTPRVAPGTLRPHPLRRDRQRRHAPRTDLGRTPGTPPPHVRRPPILQLHPVRVRPPHGRQKGDEAGREYRREPRGTGRTTP